MNCGATLRRLRRTGRDCSGRAGPAPQTWAIAWRNPLGGDRFVQHARGPGVAKSCGRCRRRIGCQKECRRRLQPAKPVNLQHLGAVHVPHIEVEKDYVELAGTQCLQGLGAVVSGHDFMRSRNSSSLYSVSIGRIVVHDQHALSEYCRYCIRVGDLLGRLDSEEIEVEMEMASRPGRAVHLDIAAHQIYDLLGDRHAETRAAVLSRGSAIGLEKRLEDPVVHLLGDSDPRVLDAESYAVPIVRSCPAA